MSRSRTLSAILFGILFLSYGYLYQGGGANAYSRYDLLHAVVRQHTLRIDTFESNTIDKARYDGHWYSDKAPGGAAIALPAFVIGYGLERFAGVHPDSVTGWHLLLWFTSIGSAALLTAAGGVFFFWILRRSLPERAAFACAMAVFLGSTLYPFATSLFSHSMAASLLTVALWAVTEPKQTARLTVLAGFACGLAVATEYPAAIPATAIGLLVLSRKKFLPAFALGAFPPLLLVALYNLAAFGSVLNIGYGYVVEFPEMQKGFFGITIPRPWVLIQLLFSEFRGLFFWSPFLLLALPGIRQLSRTSLALAWLCALVPVALLLLNGSYAYWDGGGSLGPRHLTIAVPFLGLAAALGAGRHPRAGIVLGVLSIAMISMGTFVTLGPWNQDRSSTILFLWRRWMQGQAAITLPRIMGFPIVSSYILWACAVGLLCTYADAFFQKKSRRPKASGSR